VNLFSVDAKPDIWDFSVPFFFGFFFVSPNGTFLFQTRFLRQFDFEELFPPTGDGSAFSPPNTRL